MDPSSSKSLTRVVGLAAFLYLPLQGHLQEPCSLLSKPYLHNMARFPPGWTNHPPASGVPLVMNMEINLGQPSPSSSMPSVMNKGMNLGQASPSAGMYAGGYPLIDPQYNAMVWPTNPGAFMQLIFSCWLDTANASVTFRQQWDIFIIT